MQGQNCVWRNDIKRFIYLVSDGITSEKCDFVTADMLSWLVYKVPKDYQT